MHGKNQNLISPLDSRYAGKVEEVVKYFSEDAHRKACFNIELDYYHFIKAAMEHKAGKKPSNKIEVYPAVTNDDYNAVGHYEAICKHDIKAVEYAVRDYVVNHNLGGIQYIHYGLTSQDIVSFSVTSRVKKFVEETLMPMMQQLVGYVEYIDDFDTPTPIYCRTHGQRGNVTTFSKEMEKYSTRLLREMHKMEAIEWYCKFSGSTGDLTTMDILHPEMLLREQIEQWMDKNFDISISDCATQTDNWYSICEVFTIANNMCNIMLDLSRDLWMYHMNGDIGFKTLDKMQVGSSVMPQKVNPIDLENAEGNLEMCGMWFQFLPQKLSKSRLQRDLSDSVVIRHIGIPMANMVLAIKNLCAGVINIEVKGITNMDYAVFGELVQTKLRSLGDEIAYETVKKYFRTGKAMSRPEFEAACANIFDSNDYSDIKEYITEFDKARDRKIQAKLNKAAKEYGDKL